MSRGSGNSTIQCVPELEDLSRLRSRLAATPDEERTPGDLPAAVLVPLVAGEEGWRLVFTLRSEDLPSHRGEISFPGGRVDPGEDSLAAALREAHEELGIDPAHIEIIGRLPRVATVVSGYSIDPWIGVVPGTEFRPNPVEIAEVIEVSLADLRAPGVRRDQRFVRAGAMYLSPAYDVGPHTIWGATARILTDFLAAARADLA